MSSYLSVPDYLPQVGFQPNLGFYAGALQQKQQQYSQGAQRISGLYGSLLNSPILNNQTRERRDKFFKQIQDQIQQLSEVDLSLNDNVQMASKIFQPLIDDNYVTSGIAKTKKYFNEMTRAESLRSSTDPKINSQYWGEGVQDINNWAQDYSQAQIQNAVNFKDPKYTPWYDMGKEVSGYLKDWGVEMTRSYSDGRYIWKTKNGTEVVPFINQLLEGSVGQDPRFQDMMNVKARIQRRSSIDLFTPQFGGDRNAAEDAYDSQIMRDLSVRQAQTSALLRDKHKQLDNSLKLTEKNIEDSGGVKSDNPLVAHYAAMLQQKEALNKTSQYNETFTLNPQSTFSLDREAKRSHIDNLVAGSMLSGNLLQLANAWANGNSSSEMQADPYGVQAVKFEQDKQMEAIKQIGRLQLAELKGQVKKVTPTVLTPVSKEEYLAGSGVKVDEVAKDESLIQEQYGTVKTLQKNAVNTIYNHLVQIYNDQSTDQIKRKDALDQLNNIFPKRMLQEAGYSIGGLKNSQYYNQFGWMPFGAASIILDTPSFRENHQDLIDNLNPQLVNLSRSKELADVSSERIRQNNLNILQWAKANSPRDYNTIAPLFDPKGNELHHPDLEDARARYIEIVNSSPALNGEPVYKTWFGGNAGGRAAGPMQGRFHPLQPGQEHDIMTQMENLINSGKVMGYSPGMAYTSDSKFTSDPDAEQALRAITGRFIDESMSAKGKKTATGNVMVHPIAGKEDLVAVSIRPNADFAVGNKAGKNQIDPAKYKDGITVVMNRTDAIPFFKNFEDGPITQLVKNGKPVSITQYKHAGPLTISRDRDSYNLTWNRNTYDEKGNKHIDRFNQSYSLDTDLDELYGNLVQMLPKVDQDVRTIEKRTNHGPIKSAGDVMKYLSQDRSQYAPGENTDDNQEEE